MVRLYVLRFCAFLEGEWEFERLGCTAKTRKSKARKRLFLFFVFSAFLFSGLALW